MATSDADRYARCGTCGNVQHPYLFPFKNPDADLPAPSRRTIKPTPAATYQRRLAAAAKSYEDRVRETRERRQAAQAEGRDTSKCLPCLSAEGGAE